MLLRWCRGKAPAPKTFFFLKEPVLNTEKHILEEPLLASLAKKEDWMPHTIVNTPSTGYVCLSERQHHLVQLHCVSSVGFRDTCQVRTHQPSINSFVIRVQGQGLKEALSRSVLLVLCVGWWRFSAGETLLAGQADKVSTRVERKGS